MKKTYFILIPISLLLTIIVLLLTNNLYRIDNAFYNLVIHNNYLTLFFRIITNLGSFIYIFLICIFLLLFYKNKKDLLRLYTVTILSTLINNGVKIIIKRARPALIHLVTENSYSFPSGHAMASLTFYGYLIYLLWKSNKKRSFKVIGTSLLSFLIITIGYSRIYLNVHYFSDVLAGFLFSIIILFFFIKVDKKNT